MKRKIPKIKVVAVQEIVMDRWINMAHQTIMEKLGLDITQNRYRIGISIGRRMVVGEIIAPDEFSAWHGSSTLAVDKWKYLNGWDRYDRRK